jgi:hypothetical protein
VFDNATIDDGQSFVSIHESFRLKAPVESLEIGARALALPNECSGFLSIRKSKEHS